MSIILDAGLETAQSRQTVCPGRAGPASSQGTDVCPRDQVPTEPCQWCGDRRVWGRLQWTLPPQRGPLVCSWLPGVGSTLVYCGLLPCLWLAPQEGLLSQAGPAGIFAPGPGIETKSLLLGRSLDHVKTQELRRYYQMIT